MSSRTKNEEAYIVSNCALYFSKRFYCCSTWGRARTISAWTLSPSHARIPTEEEAAARPEGEAREAKEARQAQQEAAAQPEEAPGLLEEDAAL